MAARKKMQNSQHVRYHLPQVFVENTLSNWIYAYITGKVECGCTKQQAVIDFQSLMRVDEDDMSMESILMAYNRTRDKMRLFNRYDHDNWFAKKEYRTKVPISMIQKYK